MGLLRQTFQVKISNEARRKEVEKEFGIPTYNSLTEAKNLFEINSVFVCTKTLHLY
ncbi:hypothetical protein EfmAA242_10060 [Enterococcus faecium]|nr:hypothetical protein EfmAA242_10060 [Enterococcus faecium]